MFIFMFVFRVVKVKGTHNTGGRGLLELIDTSSSSSIRLRMSSSISISIGVAGRTIEGIAECG